MPNTKKALFMLAVIAMTAVSCKKKYVCTCTDVSPAAKETIVEKGKATNKNAIRICVNAQGEYAPYGYICTVTY